MTMIGTMTSSIWLIPPWPRVRLSCASSSASTFSDARSSAISSSRLFGPGHAQRIGAAFGEIGAALKQFEAREGVLGAAAVEQFAGLGAGDGALDPVGDGVLAGAGLAQFALQLGDVGLIALERFLDDAISARRPSAMSAAFWRSISAALARSSRSLHSASSAFSVQLACSSSSRDIARRISLPSAIERAAEARTSTRVSSISRMIMRIIRAGSSARSSSSVKLAAKISRVREKIPIHCTPMHYWRLLP